MNHRGSQRPSFGAGHFPSWGLSLLTCKVAALGHPSPKASRAPLLMALRP